MSYRQLGATASASFNFNAGSGKASFSASTSGGGGGGGGGGAGYDYVWDATCNGKGGVKSILDPGDGRYTFECNDGYTCANRPDKGRLDCVYPKKQLPSPLSLCFPAGVKLHNVNNGNELILCTDDKMFVRSPDGKTDAYSQQEVRGVFEAGYRAEKKQTRPDGIRIKKDGGGTAQNGGIRIGPDQLDRFKNPAPAKSSGSSGGRPKYLSTGPLESKVSAKRAEPKYASTEPLEKKVRSNLDVRTTKVVGPNTTVPPPQVIGTPPAVPPPQVIVTPPAAPPPAKEPDPPAPAEGGLSTTAMIGIGVGVLVLVGAGFYFFKRSG